MADFINGVLRSKSITPEERKTAQKRVFEASGNAVLDYISNGPRYPNWTMGMQATVASLVSVVEMFAEHTSSVDLDAHPEKFDLGVIAHTLRGIRDMPVDISGYPGKYETVYWKTHQNEHRSILTQDLFSDEEFAGIQDRVQKELTVPRELFSEIVVHDSVFDREKKNGFSDQQIFSLSPLHPDEVILVHYHGGGYCYECPGAYRRSMVDVSESTGYRIFVPDYRLAPEHPFPAGMLDGIEFYFHLMGLGFKPENIIIMGDSAGGNLCLCIIQILKRKSAKQPRGVVALSPWCSLTPDKDSYTKNKKYDFVFASTPENPLNPSRLYVNPGVPMSENIKAMLNNPLVAPLHFDFEGCAPIYIQGGEIEMLIDHIDELAERVGAKEVLIKGKDHPGFAHPHDRNIYEKYYGMIHDFFIFQDAAEHYSAIQGIANFAKKLDNEHKQ
ncbi:hypothetical protein BB560_003902 [Smittium megazygosporum]|uniref:Alpha/beta hydrolase fold-3 domain-containing protein n=1 Tax=Smittium megazygosporum TaxID=133381 RepID=A0A2T9ZAM7_9FUNG|nr:hypothetical protein BB560_003902 [Smittium megazygosporum]